MSTTSIMDPTVPKIRIKVEGKEPIKVENVCRLSEEYIEDQNPEKKFVPFERIKCEKNCFEKVEKWCVKVTKDIKSGDDWNKIIQREITIMKVKYPFLTEKQIRGRALDKFGIPSFMGDVVRQGPFKVVGHIAQNLRLNPVYKPRIPPPFKMNVKRHSNPQKSIKKVENASISLKYHNEKSNFFSLLTENKYIQSLHAPKDRSSTGEKPKISTPNKNNKIGNKNLLNTMIETTPKKRKLLGGRSLSASRRLLDRMNSNIQDDSDFEEEKGTPKKQIKLERIENVDDLSDSEYNCIFTPRPRMKKKNNPDKENNNSKIFKSEPICFCTLSEAEKAEIILDPTIHRKKVARNLSRSMAEPNSSENIFYSEVQISQNRDNLSGVFPFEGNEVPMSSMSKNSYPVENDFTLDQMESQFLAFSPQKVSTTHRALHSLKIENVSQFSDTMNNYSRRLSSFFETSWQPSQLRQSCTSSQKTSHSSNYSHRTYASENPWRNVTSQDFSNGGRVDPWEIGGSQKTWSQDLDEICSENTDSDNSQKTLVASPPHIFNEESNDTVVSKVFRTLSLESEEKKIHEKKRNYMLSNSSSEFDKNFDINFGSHLHLGGWFAFYVKDPVDQNRIQKIIDRLYTAED